MLVNIKTHKNVNNATKSSLKHAGKKKYKNRQKLKNKSVSLMAILPYT